MHTTLADLIRGYDPTAPLNRATTPPSAWYTDSRILELERRSVFARSWQVVGRLEQIASAGRYLTANVAGEPIVVVRGKDGVARGFHNVCRHHAAEVMTAPCGQAAALTCPYHGWTYSLDGQLKGVPQFDGVCDFDKSTSGLIPARVDTWENFVFVCLDDRAPNLDEFLGDLPRRVQPLKLGDLTFVERRSYDLNCNWKVFIDNYLDGGYHVPCCHKSLGSVLDYSRYSVECADRFCVQSSPIRPGGDERTAAVRRGDTAHYFWLYPNFMINWYEGVMDTNLAMPIDAERTRVVFDFYFTHTGPEASATNAQSIEVAERVQQEDVDICESVQRGLGSRAFDVGRLSLRREGGAHLCHRLLFHDLDARIKETGGG